MKTLRAHFDAKVLQLEESADLLVKQPLEVEVRADPDWPTDGAAQHDHYLYGTSPRP